MREEKKLRMRSALLRKVDVVGAACVLALLSVCAHAQLMPGSWAKFRGNQSNTGLSPVTGPSAVEIAWTYTTGAGISSSPAVTPEGVVYITSQDRYLYSINSDGSLRWTYAIDSTNQSSPAIASDGTVYVGSEDFYLYAIRPNGTLRWRTNLGKQVRGSPSIGHAGTVYVGTMSGKLYAVSSSGSTVWSYNTGSPVVSSPAIAPNGHIRFGSEDGYLYSLNTAGQLQWQYRTSYWVDASPAIASDGTTYVSSYDGRIYSISNTGSLNWSYNVGSGMGSSPAIGPDGVIYCGSDNRYVYAINPNGTLKWRYLTGNSVWSSPAVGADGVVYVGSTDNYLYAINPDGSLLWRHDLAGKVYSSPAIGADGNLYVGSYDKKLYRFLKDSTPPTTPAVVDDGAFSTSATSLHATWSAADPQSGIAEYLHAVGTSPGAADAAGWVSSGVTPEAVRAGLTLADGVTYFFSVKARNGAGLWSEVGSSDGILVDSSAPVLPTVTDDGAFTSNSTTIHASWSSADPHTGIVDYQYALGTSPGTADVTGWTSVGVSTSVTRSGLSLPNGSSCYVSVRARNAAGLWSVVGSSDGIIVDTTAPNSPTVIDDGEFTSGTTIHATWSAADPESGVTEYQYAIGASPGASDIVGWTSVGAATEVMRDGLSLVDGGDYFVSVKARNGSGLWSAPGTSDGVKADASPPVIDFVADDGIWSTSPSSLHATWAASDPHSGIAEYSYAIGTSPGAADTAPWTSAGTATEATRGGLSLADGVTYFISVKARNRGGLWSPVASTDGITVDSTAPVRPSVTDDGQFTTAGTSLHASWSSSDPHTQVTEYQYAIGTTPGATDIVAWTSAGAATQVTRTGLSIADGANCFFSVRSRNAAGLWSEAGSSDGIIVDSSAPAAPAVTDDGAFTSSNSTLHASWTGSDPNSGVIAYQYAIGSSAGGADVVGWESVGASTEITRTGLSLQDGTAYFFSVRALNGAGLWSQNGSSNGITVDSTGPSSPVVTDDGEYTASFDTLHASWIANDSQSGVTEYEYAIGTAPGLADIRTWTSAGAASQITADGLSLEEMGTYYFAVRARNGAGLWGPVGLSNGIRVSTVPAWPQFRGDAKHQGVSRYAGSKRGAALWELSTNSWFDSSPAIGGDGTIYIGSGDAGLYAIRRDGTVMWRYETEGSIDSSPAIGRSGRIYVGSFDDYLYCISPGGSLVWRYKAGDMIWSSPVLGPDETIYVGSQDSYLYAIRPDGSLKWKYLSGGPIWSSPALSDDGVLYFGCGDGGIYAVNAADGSFRWSYLTGSAVDSSPAVGPDGTVYAGSGDGYFYALNPDGTHKWSFVTEWPVDASAVTAEDGRVYVGAGVDWWSGFLYAFDSAGSLLWEFDAKGEVRSSPVLDSAGNLYFGSGDGNIYAVTRDGALLWSAQTGNPILSSPAIAKDGIVIIGNYDGALFAYQDSDIADTTPPSIPVVADEGVATLSTSELSAAWSAVDPESGVTEYRYALGTWPGTDDIVPWTSTAAAPSALLTDLHLDMGSTYYFSVKACNRARLWSGIGVSDGITVVGSDALVKIGQAKTKADGQLAHIADTIVSARFSDCFYIQERDSSAGIRVIPDSMVVPEEGTRLDLVGTITTDRGERALLLKTFNIISEAADPAPLYMRSTDIGGGIPVAGKPCVAGGIGLNNVGVLARIVGRATAIGSDHLFLDDGSALTDPTGATGLKIDFSHSPPGRSFPAFSPGQLLRASGVVSMEWTGSAYRRTLLATSLDTP